MKDFDWSRFTKKIAIKASLPDIYAAWTQSGAIEKWFLSKAVFLDEQQEPLDPGQAYHTGCSYEWSWFLYDGAEKGTIKAANGKDALAFTFEGDCLVEVTLKEQDDYVIVELTHSNIPDTDHARQYIRLGCASGWAFYLVNLKSVYEGGLDLRNKDSRLQPMINN